MKFYMVIYNCTTLMMLFFSCCLAANVRKSRNADNLCTTKECNDFAAVLKQVLSTSVKPCDNFYDYVCDGWKKINPIPDGRTSWDNLAYIEKKNKAFVKQLIEDTSLKNRSKPEQKAVWFYTSCKTCMNRPVDIVGDEPLKEMIADLGGWNIVKTMNVQKWSLQYSLKTIHEKYGTSVLIDWKIGSGYLHFMLRSPEFFLPEVFYKEKYRDYIDTMIEILLKFGFLLGLPKDKVLAELHDLFEFERDLVQVYNRTKSPNIRVNGTISQLQKVAPFMDWLDFFKAHFIYSNFNITRDTQVKYNPQIIKKFQHFMSKALSTNSGKIRIQNYFIWRSLLMFSDVTSRSFKEVQDLVNELVYEEEPRDVDCMALTRKQFRNAVSAMYVNREFDAQSKRIASEMAQKIRLAFYENLETLKWIDEDSKKLAREKADLMKFLIAYPELLVNATELDGFYSNLSIKKYDYFGNIVRLGRFDRYTSFKERYDDQRGSWVEGLLGANAFYVPEKNHMEVPVGILQYPFFHRNYPPSLNFGAIGFIMGHEITHGFDASGRKFDAFGRLNETWKSETVNNFVNLTHCFVDQYSKYSLPVENGTMNVNGTFTLDENIADNGGIKLAYMAYQKSIEGKPDKGLPGLQFTGPQLFFLSFAYTFCSVETPESTGLLLKEDDHAPDKYRIIGILQNFPPFSEAFKCSVNSYMNPAKKCKIW